MFSTTTRSPLISFLFVYSDVVGGLCILSECAVCEICATMSLLLLCSSASQNALNDCPRSKHRNQKCQEERNKITNKQRAEEEMMIRGAGGEMFS